MWLKLNQEGSRRFWSMFPLTRASHFGTVFLSHSQIYLRDTQTCELLSFLTVLVLEGVPLRLCTYAPNTAPCFSWFIPMGTGGLGYGKPKPRCFVHVLENWQIFGPTTDLQQQLPGPSKYLYENGKTPIIWGKYQIITNFYG